MSKKYLVTQDQTVDGMPLEGSAVIHYTTCSTAAATAAKTAALSGFKLVTGASVIVKFSATNTAASPTLNINNTGAMAIRYKNAAIPAGYLAANKVYSFVYDGTYWQLVGDVDTGSSAKVYHTCNAIISSNSYMLYYSGITEKVQAIIIVAYNGNFYITAASYADFTSSGKTIPIYNGNLATKNVNLKKNIEDNRYEITVSDCSGGRMNVVWFIGSFVQN